MNDINYILNGYPFFDFCSALINNTRWIDSNDIRMEWIKRNLCFLSGKYGREEAKGIVLVRTIQSYL